MSNKLIRRVFLLVSIGAMITTILTMEEQGEGYFRPHPVPVASALLGAIGYGVVRSLHKEADADMTTVKNLVIVLTVVSLLAEICAVVLIFLVLTVIIHDQPEGLITAGVIIVPIVVLAITAFLKKK